MTTLSKTISSTNASNHFGSMLAEASAGESLFVVTRMGKPAGILMGIEQYREMLELLETAEELQDVEFLAGIQEARDDIQLGKTMSLTELDEALGY